MATKTAVDYLVKEFSEVLGKIVTSPMQDLLIVDAVNKAKELEKQQIKDAWDNGAIDASYGTKYKSYEDYYFQTYGGGDE